jgi:lysophospholipase L1-like esterase
MKSGAVSGARQSEREQARRIVVLGDSIVYGQDVPREASYPARLEAYLNADNAGRPWRVINAGVPGETVIQGCLRYAREVAPLAPEVILIGYGLNDAALRRTRFDAQREQIWQAQRRPLLRLRFAARRLVGPARRLIRWLRTHLGRADETIEHQAEPRVQRELFKAGLAELIQRAQSDGARPILLCLTPIETRGMPALQARTYGRYDALIAEVATDHDVPLVRWPQEALPPQEIIWQDDGIHPTAAGYDWIAGRLHNALCHLLKER